MRRIAVDVTRLVFWSIVCIAGAIFWLWVVINVVRLEFMP